MLINDAINEGKRSRDAIALFQSPRFPIAGARLRFIEPAGDQVRSFHRLWALGDAELGLLQQIAALRSLHNPRARLVVKGLLLGVLAAYLAIVLFGYAKSDPGWSHAVYVERVSNPGGRFGAWLSDLLLYLFGLSAWWWVGFLGVGLAVGFRRLQREHGADRRSLFIVMAGFLVVLVASSGLESMRFHTLRATLPLEPGGLIGVELGSAINLYLGFTGGTLLLLTLIAAGLSLFSGVSWVEASEAVGGALEAVWHFALHGAQTWEDRRVGREVAQKREAVVETKRKKEEAAPAPPVRIEPAVVEVPRSERVVKERQAALFVELPGGKLPPLSLLDEPADDVEPPSVESLEFTSRLIERKLADFGVSLLSIEQGVHADSKSQC